MENVAGLALEICYKLLTRFFVVMAVVMISVHACIILSLQEQ